MTYKPYGKNAGLIRHARGEFRVMQTSGEIILSDRFTGEAIILWNKRLGAKPCWILSHKIAKTCLDKLAPGAGLYTVSIQ